MKPLDIKPHAHTTTIARVQLIVEVDVGSWGPGCSLDQVYRQAEEEAQGALNRLFRPEAHKVRIVSTAKVLMLTTSMEERK